ncbi:MAG: ANTAR domain-containing protein [Ilumatobacteraceae bacterium]
MNAVQSLAELAAATIDHARTIDRTSRLVGQLQSALDNRVVLEQAKGMVAERLGIDCRAAFVEIRNRARREQRAIGDVASDIVGSRSNGD